MSEDTTKLLNACVEYREMVDKLEAENTTLKQYIANKICPTCDWKALLEAQEKENATLRETLDSAMVLLRRWNRNDVTDDVVIETRKAIYAARKEAQP